MNMFVVCAVMAMLMNLGAFCRYQSLLGKTILIVDIMIYVSTMLCGALLACELSQKKWAQKMAGVMPFGFVPECVISLNRMLYAMRLK